MKSINFPIIFLVVLYVACLQGCKKPSDSPAPPMPPASSMEMEGLSDFITKKKSTLVSADSSNYKKAWKLVHCWDSITNKLLEVPLIFFLEAISDKSAEYDDSTKQWTWTFNKTILGDGSYQAIFGAQVETDSVYWNMTVSRINGEGLFHFVWFDGRTDVKQTGGWWKLYDPTSGNAYMLINWAKKDDQGKWIKYTLIDDTYLNKNDFILYGTNTATDYNAYFNIGLLSQGINAQIEWNISTYAGKITSNNLSYSWDNSLNNTQ